MRFQFKVHQYQTDAVDAIVDSFSGQPKSDGISYRLDPGRLAAQAQPRLGLVHAQASGLRNAEIALTPTQLLGNIHAVQRSRNLPLSPHLAESKAARPGSPNLDVEMETGTGKTYVYIKTMMEMHKRYGWGKYIVVVPSVAIREGVKKSFDVTAEHFQQTYGTKPRSFVYNSSQLHELERFSSDAGVQVMIINIQAFNATGKEAAAIKTEEGIAVAAGKAQEARELTSALTPEILADRYIAAIAKAGTVVVPSGASPIINLPQVAKTGG